MPEQSLYDYKQGIEERLKEVEKIRRNSSKSDNFQLIAQRINSIVDVAVLSQDIDEIKSALKELKLIQKNINILRDTKELGLEESTILRNTILKVEKSLQKSFKTLGGKENKKGELKTPEETLKGKIKDKLKYNLGEGIGAVGLALFDSPLLLIAGQWFDEQLQKKRDKKLEEIEKEQELIDSTYEKKLKELEKSEKELESPDQRQKRKEQDKYDEQLKKILEKKQKENSSLNDKLEETKKELEKINKELKIKSNDKLEKKKNNLIEQINDLNSEINSNLNEQIKAREEQAKKNVEALQESDKSNDSIFKGLLSDMGTSAQESFDELGLDDSLKKKLNESFKNFPIQSDNESKKEPIDDSKEEIPKINKDLKEEIKNVDIPKINNRDFSYSSDVINRYLPSIDEQLHILNKNFNLVESEDQVLKRDMWLEGIYDSLTVKKKGNLEENDLIKKEEEDSLLSSLKGRNISKLVGVLGKGLAAVGAFSAGWMIGKQLDKMFGLTENIQGLVDKVQKSVDERSSEFIAKNFTNKAKDNLFDIENIKRKTGLKRFTNKDAYNLLKEKPNVMNELHPREQKILKEKAAAYKPYATPLNIPEFQNNVIPTYNASNVTNISTMDDVPISENISTNSGSYASIPTVIPGISDSSSTNSENMQVPMDFDGLNVKRNVNIDGLQPQIKNNLMAMGEEYYRTTGEKIDVNSGKRSYEDQKRLYESNPEKAAPPGLSMHEFGYAADVDSKDANKLAQLGLLDKYGFDRPISREPWHIEEEGIKPLYSKIRKGEISDSPSKVQTGDAEIFRDLRANYTKREMLINNRTTSSDKSINNNVISQNTTVIKPRDYRFFIEDDYLRHSVYNKV